MSDSWRESDSWQEKVGRVLEEALRRPPERRAAFLETRCEEEALREEVASLLVAHEEESGLFEELAGGAAASALGELMERPAKGADGEHPEGEAPSGKGSDPLGLEGERVGRYVAEEHLGGGGMGIVYRARDPELGRAVALKFLPPHLAASEEADQRFAREAKAAASLDHPHIATIYEIGRVEAGEAQGQRYIAMAYYEGETLKEKLEREGPLPIGEALRYAEQVAGALSATHEAGVVHRDVKPANVMVTDGEQVKLLDFGLARLAETTRLTGTGQQLGTASYMSPEQIEGEEVGPAADLWALGALLYEMLAGERPFAGERRATVLHAVLHEEPAPLTGHRDEVSPGLEQVVRRCLEKDPAGRYGSAEALREDLRALHAGEEPASEGKPPPVASGQRRGRRRWALGAVAALLLAVAAALGWALWPSGTPEGESSPPTVAVLPFEVSGSGAETWRDGMVTALSLNLDGAAGLRAIADRTVFAAWEKQVSSNGSSGDDSSNEGTSTESALAVAREVGARYAVVGSAVQLGGELRLAAEVRRAGTGGRLGQVEVRGEPERVTGLTDRLTRKVLGVLLERSEDQVPSVDLASITTSSLPALKAYLRGEQHYRSAQYEAAIEDYEAAVSRDSAFALAYARLGLCHGWLVNLEKNRQYWQKAAKHAGQLPQRERRIVRAVHLRNGGRAVAAADSLRRISADYPDDPAVWYALGETLYHNAVPRGLPEADTAFGRAIDLDPGMAPYHHHFVDMAFSVHHDSTLAAERLAQHPSSGRYKAGLENSKDLVFGTPAERQAVIDSLGSVPLNPFALNHPTDGELWVRVLKGWDPPVAEFLFRQVAGANFLHGHLQSAYRRAVREWSPSDRACLLAYAASLSMPVPDSLTEEHVVPKTLTESTSTRRLKCAGLSLADQGRAKEVATVTRLLESKGEDVTPVIKELEGYRAFRAGSLQEADRLWAGHNESGRFGAVWRGDLYRTLGKLRTAKGWYQAAWQIPLAHERLGRLYEKMGRPEKARAAYDRFVDAWDDADPELQPRVERARNRIETIGRMDAAE
jgi:serine/threonine-protein kinase